MSDQFPNIGAMPPRGGHAPSLSAGAASAQAGMTRIQRGGEVRYVWPVHLPGWLATGWQVGSGEGGAAAMAAAPVVVTPNPLAPHPAAASAPRSTHGSGRHRQLAPSPSAPQPVPATTDPAVAEPTASVAGQAISTTSAADSPRQADADLTAHLPTNLLGLDEVEPTREQAAPAGNDAVSAWNPEPEAAGPPVDAGEPGGETTAQEPGEAAAPAEVEAPAADVASVTEPPAAAVTDAPEDPAPQPAPARRGRPRKVRPEAQAEPAAATAAEGPAPTPAAHGPAPTSANEGDDPFGLDPLL
jgi:nicotinate-nucleotide--dimethylbenzimidazole phosphoribosyltransferase